MPANSVILDINDAALCLWQGGKAVLRSPGYALLSGSSYRFGEEARAQARLHPRQINHRFWSQLDTEPLHPAFGSSRHSADLVHAHLLAIHEAAGRPERIILAAPGNLQHNQLALLLGIIQQCPFQAVGLVDRAVAAVAEQPVAAYNWHVELQLHQALVTGLQYSDGLLQRDSVTAIPGSGWLALQDSLAKSIADAFIRQTRFDPRRQAATEQALYDQLPELLARLREEPEHNLELGGHRARVERELLVESCQAHYQRIQRALGERRGPVGLDPTLSSLPDIMQFLPGSAPLPADSACNCIARHLDAVEGADGSLPFITSLPATAAESADEPLREATAPDRPAQATPATAPTPATRCQIDMEGHSLILRHLSGPAPRLNGTPVSGAQSLDAGDLIEMNDGTGWRLVEVRPDDGPQA
jgi:hypothetical protein